MHYIFFFFDEEASIKLTKATPKATKNYNKALAAAAATGRPSAASFSPQEERHPATLGKRYYSEQTGLVHVPTC